MDRVPVIDVTDLYHPPQDPGDNFDLVAAYALPEVDLRAVILDVTDRYRGIFADHSIPDYVDPNGPREPGIIPVIQLNYIFGRAVPFAVGPFSPMRAPDDPMRDIPPFQQQGVELILEVLRTSREPVDILSFGSARPIAVAYNRDPGLFRAKVRRIHLCAGSTSSRFLRDREGVVEWNVMLDPHAIVRLLRSDLPVAIYPCATDEGGFAYSRHNTYWKLPRLDFVASMDPRLKRYLWFAFERAVRVDFLRALEEDPCPATWERVYRRAHHVWETAVWLSVSGRRLVRRADGTCRILPAAEVGPGDRVLPNELRPCSVRVLDDGRFDFELVDGSSRFAVYDRVDPFENERALQEALPALYVSFRP